MGERETGSRRFQHRLGRAPPPGDRSIIIVRDDDGTPKPRWAGRPPEKTIPLPPSGGRVANILLPPMRNDFPHESTGIEFAIV